MMTYHSLFTPVYVEQQEPPCGTVACIAGWAWHKWIKKDPNESIYTIAGQGRKALDLDAVQAHKLFFVSEWPVDFYRRYVKATLLPDGPRLKAQAKIAAEYIEYFIAREKELEKIRKKALRNWWDMGHSLTDN